MKIKAEINLDELYPYDGESFAEIVRSEIEAEVKRQVRANLKADEELKKLVKKHGSAAIKALADKL